MFSVLVAECFIHPNINNYENNLKA